MSRNIRRLLRCGLPTVTIGIAFVAGQSMPARAQQDTQAPPAATAAAPLDIGDCPETAGGFEQGKTYQCECPAKPGEATIWGSGVYTEDSNICVAAIHAGATKNDAGGRVLVRIVESPPVFKGTTRNGIKSEVWLKPRETAFEIAPAK